MAAPHLDTSEFLLTPYKIYLSLIIHVFTADKGKATQQEIGRFSKLIMKLIQSLDCRYATVRNTLIAYKLEELLRKCDDKVDEFRSQGLCSVMELISNTKMPETIHRTSILGLFVRRMNLYFDKLSFNSLSVLYEEFVGYIGDNDETMGDASEEMTEHARFGDNLAKTCPKQIQFFLSKQINMISVNEKKALNPNELYSVISSAINESGTSGTAMSGPNELNFLRYVNSLRIREYIGAKEALVSYFDTSTVHSSKCWAVYNLASLHFQFGHNGLAFEALRECISSAQDANEDKCLEFCLLLLSKLIIRQKSNSGSTEDLMALLSHLQTKATKLDLHALAASAGLHYEQLVGAHVERSSSALPSDILAVRYSLNDVLMASLAGKAALFAEVGGTDFNTLLSQSLLHLYAVEPIGDELVYHVNESTCIGIRNIALGLWKIHGEFDAACDVLVNLAATLFSTYASDINTIWKQALAEIKFERHLFSKNWREARLAVETLRCFNEMEAELRLAELVLKQKNREEAYSIILKILEDKSISEHFKVRALLLESRILQNLSIVLQAIGIAKQSNLHGLEALCVIELSEQLFELGQNSQAIEILNRHFLSILSSATCHDIGRACFSFARNLKSLSRATNDERLLQKSIRYSEMAIAKFVQVNDEEFLIDSLRFQVQLCHEVGAREKRNYFARKLRLIQE